MIVYYMRGKHGHSCAGATHMTKVFVKRTILFLQCIHSKNDIVLLTKTFVIAECISAWHIIWHYGSIERVYVCIYCMSVTLLIPVGPCAMGKHKGGSD